MNCPINEQIGEGIACGRCCLFLPDGMTCPRHGDVYIEVAHFNKTGKTTLENTMRARKGKQLLGGDRD